MLEKFTDHWPYWVLTLFAVVSGQIGRLGYKGKPITRRVVWIELSMLPAFGSIGGSYFAEHDSPVYVILIAGVLSGWLGFACFTMAASLAVTLVQTTAERIVGAKKPTPPEA